MSDRKAAFNDKHHRRALAAIANHRCVTDLTDGFCGPDDHAPAPVTCHRRSRDCVVQAEGALQSLANRGMMVVWVYDKELPPEVATVLKERFERGGA